VNFKTKRSASASADFMRQTDYPKGRKGYVVDHIVPLECGGADVPSNMQWQTVQEAKIKDRSERKLPTRMNFRQHCTARFLDNSIWEGGCTHRS
jgi:hypothetical protein